MIFMAAGQVQHDSLLRLAFSSGGTIPLTWTKTDKGIRLDKMDGKTLMELEYIAGLETKCLELKTKEGRVFKR
jgi:hypothetical protein